MYDFSGKYILIDRLGFDRDEFDNKRVMTIEEEYKEFIEIADTLKHESKGMINLYKSGNYHDTALSLFDRVSKYINPEPILQDEAEGIKLSSFGALTWCEPYTDELYKYEDKRMYPYLMSSTTLKFPVKRVNLN